MLRRLYFLLPDEEHAEALVDDLFLSGTPKHFIHAIDNGQRDLKNLPGSGSSLRHDYAALLETLLWFGNLWIFFFAAVAFIVALFYSAFTIAALMSLIMLLTFYAGERFVAKLPNTHLDNFTEAIQHGEILLMVDVPFYNIRKISDYVHTHHPQAQFGGVCWSIDALGV
jgi:hypothetical protein